MVPEEDHRDEGGSYTRKMQKKVVEGVVKLGIAG